ncbi:hypothetical protein Trydic_g5907 [Trypoxylus dichotomus]
MLVYTSELIAVYEVCKSIKSAQQNVLIILDYRSVVEKLDSINTPYKINPLIIQTYHESHGFIHKAELLWVNGCIGIVGNETEDTFAKLECTLSEILDHKLSPIDSAQFALQPIYSYFVKTNTGNFYKAMQPTPAKRSLV